MNDQELEQLRRRFGGGGDFTPPAELLDRIKADIPQPSALSQKRSDGREDRKAAWRLAASVAMLFGFAYIGARVFLETRLKQATSEVAMRAPSAPVAQSASTEEVPRGSVGGAQDAPAQPRMAADDAVAPQRRAEAVAKEKSDQKQELAFAYSDRRKDQDSFKGNETGYVAVASEDDKSRLAGAMAPPVAAPPPPPREAEAAKPAVPAPASVAAPEPQNGRFNTDTISVAAASPKIETPASVASTTRSAGVRDEQRETKSAGLALKKVSVLQRQISPADEEKYELPALIDAVIVIDGKGGVKKVHLETALAKEAEKAVVDAAKKLRFPDEANGKKQELRIQLETKPHD